MDPITQGALGAACAQVVLHKQDKYNAWIVGGLAGMAADLDVLINSSKDPLLFFFYHRHFTHSLMFIPIGAALVTLFLTLFKRFRQHKRLTFLAALIGYGTHGLLDTCTNYGTVLYWPFTNTRVHWDLISIIDPFFTFPLVLGLVWTKVHDSRKGVAIGLILASFFLLVNSFQHYRAIEAVQTFAEKNHLKLEKLRVFPKMSSSITWRGVSLINNYFLAFNVTAPFLQKAKVSIAAKYQLAQSSNLPKYVKESPLFLKDFSIFNWFTGGYLILVKSEPLILADGRFLMDDDPTISLWGIQFSQSQPVVYRLNFINLEE
ncbi:metal-dependent hydrolase [Legionella brunensis]|uniref:Integral membrane protein n=1 Tax=Legionella brunensis TaxID=29422 RepID=A0A0W0S0U6_9GAMM|nr:metal-dependent hydrolase [Legionella brunensis]KTC77119.1 integral membrane protein [Legionella brunensis]